MTSPAVGYTLDTSILVHYVRQSRLWAYIRGRYNLFAIDPKPRICVVTVGELRSLAEQRGWGRGRLNHMAYAISYFRRTDVSRPRVLDAYTEIDSRFAGSHAIGDNDLWIAAAAIATGTRLLTTDRDFDPVHAAGLLDREWVDPTLGGP